MLSCNAPLNGSISYEHFPYDSSGMTASLFIAPL
jgi:hypothetical protein